MGEVDPRDARLAQLEAQLAERDALIARMRKRIEELRAEVARGAQNGECSRPVFAQSLVITHHSGRGGRNDDEFGAPLHRCNRLEDELDSIAADVCKPDSMLNRLPTKKK